MVILDAIIALLAAFNRAVGHVVKWAALTLIGVMTAMVLVHVVLRFAAESPSWTEEVSIFMMIWIAFLVAPVAFRTGANVSIELVKTALGLRVRALLEAVFAALSIWVIVVLLGEAGVWVERNMNRTANTVRVPLGLVYLALPVGLGLTLASAAEVALRAVRVLVDPRAGGEHPFHDPGAAPQARETGVAVESLRD